MRSVAVLLMVLVTLPGRATVFAQDPGPVGKVAVSARGLVSFDGSLVTIDGLKAKLADLKRRNGVVWYYRESAGAEPPVQAMEVVKLVMAHQLPISMSTKPDYSDVVMPDGTVRPRAVR